MEKYRVVPLKRDRISGWVVENTYPRELRQPRMLYQSEKKAKEVAARLNGQEEPEETRPPGAIPEPSVALAPKRFEHVREYLTQMDKLQRK
ncbi:MAG: hypothetical protein ABSC26_08340 [Stellaceae bacterium]